MLTDAATWWQLLLVVAATHVGLELVVQLVVYPALARSSTGDLAWAALHRRLVRVHRARLLLAVALLASAWWGV